VGYPETDGDQQARADREFARLARHDPAAFTPLYDRYVTGIYQYCYRRLGHREAAEDATSLVFVKALAAIGGYGGESFRSWLFTIAHNVVVDCYRQRGNHLPHQPLDAASAIHDRGPTPEETALHRDQQRGIRALLDELPDDQRAAVELRLAGLNGVEIASVLGRSHGAVKNLQYRAIQRLRALLEASHRQQTDPTLQEAHDARPLR
jgi:RNA polymerase sigma-70 factor, ECF subfamily